MPIEFQEEQLPTDRPLINQPDFQGEGRRRTNTLSETMKFVKGHSEMETVNLEEDSDEGGNIFEKNAQNELSHDKMCYIRNTRHPRALELDEDSHEQRVVLHSLCFSKLGWSHCNKNMRKTDYGVYGVGVVLYFQFLKYLCVMMFLFTILSVPSYLMFSNGMRSKDFKTLDQIESSRRLEELNN